MKSLKHWKKSFLLEEICKGRNVIGFSHTLFSPSTFTQILLEGHNNQWAFFKHSETEQGRSMLEMVA